MSHRFTQQSKVNVSTQSHPTSHSAVPTNPILSVQPTLHSTAPVYPTFQSSQKDIKLTELCMNQGRALLQCLQKSFSISWIYDFEVGISECFDLIILNDPSIYMYHIHNKLNIIIYNKPKHNSCFLS